MGQLRSSFIPASIQKKNKELLSGTREFGKGWEQPLVRVCRSPAPSKCSHCAMEGEISRSSSVLPPSESLTHPGNAPELPRWDQPSPAVLVPRGEATKEREACGTKGMGTHISHCLGHWEKGEASSGSSTLSLNLRKDQTARGEGTSQLPGNSSPQNFQC